MSKFLQLCLKLKIYLWRGKIFLIFGNNILLYSILNLGTAMLFNLMWRIDSLEKTPMLGLKAGGEGDNKGWDGWMASLTRWTWVWVAPGAGDGQGSLACCSPWGCKESDMTEWLNCYAIQFFLVIKHMYQFIHVHDYKILLKKKKNLPVTILYLSKIILIS